jgi:hypothetical protein
VVLFMLILVLWVVTPYGLADRYQHFRGTYHLNLQGNPEDLHQHLYCYENFKSHMVVWVVTYVLEEHTLNPEDLVNMFFRNIGNHL